MPNINIRVFYIYPLYSVCSKRAFLFIAFLLFFQFFFSPSFCSSPFPITLFLSSSLSFCLSRFSFSYSPLFSPSLFLSFPFLLPRSHSLPSLSFIPPPIHSPLFPSPLSVPRSRLRRPVSLSGVGIMKNAPIDRAPQLRLAEMGHDRPRSILIPSYNVSTNESISAKFSIFQKPTRETGISSFVKILLSISSAI